MYVIDFNVCNRITRVPLEERRRENTIHKKKKKTVTAEAEKKITNE